MFPFLNKLPPLSYFFFFFPDENLNCLHNASNTIKQTNKYVMTLGSCVVLFCSGCPTVLPDICKEQSATTSKKYSGKMTHFTVYFRKATLAQAQRSL